MVILTSIGKRTSRRLDDRSRFYVLGKAATSPMGRSLPSPLGLSHRERTKVEKISPPSPQLQLLHFIWVSCSWQLGSSRQGHLSTKSVLASAHSSPLFSLSALQRYTGQQTGNRRHFCLQGLLPLQTECLQHIHNPGVSLLPSVVGPVQHLTAANLKLAGSSTISKQQLPAPAALPQKNKAQRTILLSSGWQGNLNYTPKGCGLWKTRKNV